MEDYELVSRLRKHGAPAIVPYAIQTSGRRWQTIGFLRTALTNQVSVRTTGYVWNEALIGNIDCSMHLLPPTLHALIACFPSMLLCGRQQCASEILVQYCIRAMQGRLVLTSSGDH